VHKVGSSVNGSYSVSELGGLAFKVSNSIGEEVICTAGPLGVGAIQENPQFEDPDINDFHLKVVSPCIDAGTHVVLQHYEGDRVTDDIDYDHERFTGIDNNGLMVLPSIGADELSV